MGFAILIYIYNDAFNMIKTYHFIIYILEYVVEKPSSVVSYKIPQDLVFQARLINI